MSAPPEASAGPPAGNRSPGEAARALASIVLIYALLAGMGLVSLPASALSRRAALGWAKRYCRSVRWLLRTICGIGWEVRGPVPDGTCIVAAKHQSFLDVLMLIEALPRPRFVMKRSLLWVPVIGFYARRLGCVPIDRKARGEAVRIMLEGFAARADEPGQFVIFPQGTRVAPGVRAPFRAGVLRLYESCGLPVALAAVNTGWFWPRSGVRRTPGTAVVEFVGTIPPGQPGALLNRIETAIEAGSDRLAAEAAAEIARQGAA